MKKDINEETIKREISFTQEDREEVECEKISPIEKRVLKILNNESLGTIEYVLLNILRKCEEHNIFIDGKNVYFYKELYHYISNLASGEVTTRGEVSTKQEKAEEIKELATKLNEAVQQAREMGVITLYSHSEILYFNVEVEERIKF